MVPGLGWQPGGPLMRSFVFQLEMCMLHQSVAGNAYARWT